MEEKRIPSRVLWIVIDQVKELMGERTLRTLFAQAGLPRYDENNLPPRDDSPSVTVDEYARVLYAIRNIFGEKGARALMLKGGKAAFDDLRGANPNRYAVVGMALKVLPEAKRIQLALGRLIEESGGFYGNEYRLVDEKDAFVVEIHDSPYCRVERQRIAEGQPPLTYPICHIAVGAYSALVEWVAGKPRRVEEVECAAMGAPCCRVRVEKEG